MGAFVSPLAPEAVNSSLRAEREHCHPSHLRHEPASPAPAPGACTASWPAAQRTWVNRESQWEPVLSLAKDILTLGCPILVKLHPQTSQSLVWSPSYKGMQPKQSHIGWTRTVPPALKWCSLRLGGSCVRAVYIGRVSSRKLQVNPSESGHRHRVIHVVVNV